MEELNLEEALSNIERVKMLKNKNQIKESTSIRPLKFEIDEINDSPIKKMILERINERNLTYSDLYRYCTQIKNGNIAEGKNYGSNLINGLRKGNDMRGETFFVLANFLDLEIILRERKIEKVEEKNEENS